MSDLQGWKGVAYNAATASENQIHADDVARRYGFRGGLVPGVTVYAYLVQPAVAAWGLDWLERGTATVALRKPLYEGGEFRVVVQSSGATGYHGEVLDSDGVLCADGEVALPNEAGPAPKRRGDPQVGDRGARPDATREVLEKARERGLGAVRFKWSEGTELDRTSRDLDAMPDLVRLDRGGYANPGFALGMANWILSSNVRLGPWIHVESDVRNHAAIPRGSALVGEASVVDVFERGGHEFVDLDVAIFLEPDTPALSARHRAIYRPRAHS